MEASIIKDICNSCGKPWLGGPIGKYHDCPNSLDKATPTSLDKEKNRE